MRLHPHTELGVLVDLTVQVGDRRLTMLGAAGARRETAILDQLDATGAPAPLQCPASTRPVSAPSASSAPSAPDTPDTPDTASKPATGLPVLVGAGLGFALEALLQRTSGPVAVLDKEADMLALTQVHTRFADPRVRFITDADPHKALAALTAWQNEHGGRPFIPLINPFYQRLDKSWYGLMRDNVTASAAFNFWEKAVSPRFVNREPRLLLITSKYFLMGEIVGACQRLGFPTQLLTLEDESIAGSEFVARLLTAVVTFKPDCVLTMNHLGIDREGLLVELLEKLRLPLASWFVDNPHLIVHLYAKLASPWTTLFSWDADNLPMLRDLGFPHAAYLPLGTDPQRFRPRPGEKPFTPLLPTRVSFVGNSMVYKVGMRLSKTHLPRALLLGYKNTAARFSAADERSAREFVLHDSPHLAAAYEALPNDEERLAFETLLTWEATRQYRAACVQEILPFSPLIVGDRGWKQIFRHSARPWALHPEVTYYEGLPRVYPFSEINFNCTSKQMKGAVNQRIFDVPAAGGFVLTDWREQMDALFEPGKEVVCFHDPSEVGDLVRYYLKHPTERQRVARAAHKRVLAEHTWDHRVLSLLKTMREIYG